MNILQVHNKYKVPGGERTVLNQEYELLKQKHSVEQLLVDNTEAINTLFDKLKLVFTTHYNRSSRELVKQKLLNGDIDVMHVHNFFPLLTPSIFDASVETGVPSVFTLHNYRLFYPNGLLQHNGKIDERTIRGSAYSTVWEGVYRKSVFQTAVVAHMIEYHRKKGTWNDKVDCFICLTEFAKSKFIEAGLPEEKIRVKPNFVPDYMHNRQNDKDKMRRNSDSFYLFVGRISEEKGIRTLLSAWQDFRKEKNRTLVIIGDGPIKAELQKKYRALEDRVRWLGYLEWNEVIDYVMRAQALIFPSEWYEGMPMSILEAFSVGTPVISSDIGSQAEIVTPDKNGLHFQAGSTESLIRAIDRFEEDRDFSHFLSREARIEYEEKYSPEANYSKLISIYKSL